MLSSQTEPTDQILIQDLHLRCVIGIQAWERQVRQDVLINITLFTSLTDAGKTDRIEETVDYRKLTKRIIAMTEASSFFLVEALAEKIAEICLETPGVMRSRVSVEKPGALRFARSVGVVIERSCEPPTPF